MGLVDEEMILMYTAEPSKTHCKHTYTGNDVKVTVSLLHIIFETFKMSYNACNSGLEHARGHQIWVLISKMCGFFFPTGLLLQHPVESLGIATRLLKSGSKAGKRDVFRVQGQTSATLLSSHAISEECSSLL